MSEENASCGQNEYYRQKHSETEEKKYSLTHEHFLGGVNVSLVPSGLPYFTYVTVQNTKSNISDTQHLSTGLQPKSVTKVNFFLLLSNVHW